MCGHDTCRLRYNGAVVMLEGERLACDGRQCFIHFCYITRIGPSILVNNSSACGLVLRVFMSIKATFMSDYEFICACTCHHVYTCMYKQHIIALCHNKFPGLPNSQYFIHFNQIQISKNSNNSTLFPELIW